MSEPTLEQELTLLAQRLPAFAQVLLHAIQRGLIHGAPPMTQIVWPAGDAYQHLAHGDDRQGRELAHAVRRGLGMSEWLLTPMERLLCGVRPGERLADSPPDGPLVTLAQALHPFLSPSSGEGQAPVPLVASQPSLWQMTEAERGIYPLLHDLEGAARRQVISRAGHPSQRAAGRKRTARSEKP